MSRSFASFATLEEAWGGIGQVRPPPMCTPPARKPETVPAPSDVGFNRSGAPIMDDIVNLYTPANAPVACKDVPVPPVPVPDPVSSAPAVQKRIRIGKGDDYSDSDQDDETLTPTAVAYTPGPRQIPSVNDATAGIELAAYVLSGVMLIFLFESFITLGGHLRSAAMIPY